MGRPLPSFHGFVGQADNAGTLAIAASTTLLDTTRLTIAEGAVVNLADGVNETVNELYLGSVWQKAGTWGSSSASPTPDHTDDTHFSGTGVLTVLTSPPPAGTVLVIL